MENNTIEIQPSEIALALTLDSLVIAVRKDRFGRERKNARLISAVQILADQDFGAAGWNEQCNQAAIVLRNLLKKS